MVLLMSAIERARDSLADVTYILVPVPTSPCSQPMKLRVQPLLGLNSCAPINSRSYRAILY